MILRKKNNISHLKFTKSSLGIVAAGMSVCNFGTTANAQGIKWNVVVLMTDMQNVHFIGSDHQSRENISTPNLDKLGRDGMVFRKAYDAFPVSAPTRASLLTGTYPMKHEQYGNSVHLLQAGPQGKTPSLAHVFRDNGYNTAMFGKQHSNTEEYENMVDGTIEGKNVFAGWDFRMYGESEGTATAGAINPTAAEQSAATLYQNKLNSLITNLKGEYRARYSETVVGRPMLQWEKDVVASSGVSAKGLGHSTDMVDGIFAYAALDYLETFAGVRNDSRFVVNRTKPLFMFLSFNKPHYAFTVPLLCDGTEWWHMYSGRPEDNNSTYLRNGVPTPVIVPATVTDSLFYEDPTSPYQYSREKHNNYPFARAKYSGLISWIDHMMGKVIDKLAVLDDPNNPGKKMSETTIVVFTTDHGDMMGQKQRINKNVSYEGSARVPFLIRMPGVITPGQKSDILLNHVDMFPTLAGLVGLGDKLNTTVLDGKDLSQVVIANNAAAGPQRTFTINAAKANSYPGQIYSRTQKYKFTRWNDGSKVGNQPAMLLFDMNNDPYETKNLAYNPAYRSIVTTESKECDIFMKKFYPTLPSTVIPALAQCTLTVNTDAVKGTVTSNPAQGAMTENTVVKLTAVAKSGYKFTGWSGASTKTTSSIELVMDANKTITANYVSTGTSQTPYGGVNWSIPGVVECENYDAGGEGYAYHDNATKQGDLTIRTAEMVDLLVKSNTAKDVVVGFPVLGEWLEYTVDTEAAKYDMTLKYFCNTTSAVGDLEVSMDDMVLGTFTDIVTQGSNTKQAVVIIPDISISAGKNKILRLEYVNGARFDIDAILFTKSAMQSKAVARINENTKDADAISVYPNPVSSILNINFPDAASNRDIELYNSTGQLVYNAQTQNSNVQIDVQSLMLKGLVLIKLINGDVISNHRIIVK